MASGLDFFASLVGQCFAATVAPGTVDRHCFSTIYEGAHVRDVHTVTANGKAVYRGETIYSRSGAGLAFTYVNSTGGVGHGTAQVEGRVMNFSGSMIAAPREAPAPIDGRWRIEGRGYVAESQKVPPRVFEPSR
jgi:hypothetical protein